MKAGWQAKSLAEVLLKTETVNPNSQPEANFEYIDVSSVSNQKFQIEETQNLKGKDAPSRARKLVKTNDILFATIRPTLQRIAIVPSKFNNQVCSTGYFVLRPNQSIHYKYLYYYLFADSFMGQMESLQKGASYPAVTDNEVKSQNISFPSIQEQKRIVAILDQAFKGIAKARENAEQNLQNARALFESHLQSVFTQRGEGWVEKKLGEVCDLVNGFAFKSSDVVETSHTQLVRMGNLYGNTLSLDRSPVFYPDAFAQIHRNYLLVKDDLIMSLTGTTGKEDYGYTVKIPNCNHVLLMNQRIVKFEILNTKLINRNFLMHYLRSRVFLDELYLTANGTRQANLSSVVIKTLPIPVCAIENQQSIAETLNAFSEEAKCLEAIYHRKIELLDELKKSLLQQAFAGEL